MARSIMSGHQFYNPALVDFWLMKVAGLFMSDLLSSSQISHALITGATISRTQHWRTVCIRPPLSSKIEGAWLDRDDHRENLCVH